MSDVQQFLLERLYPFAAHGLRIVLIAVGTWILTKIIRRSFPRLSGLLISRMTRRHGESNTEMEKRAQTLGGMLVTVLVVVLWSVAVIMMLKEAGFDIGPILAGAGIIGLAVGFGAQNLVRDVISGALILMENQVRVGDVAIINGTGGLVERLNLRTIILRSLDGTVHIFPHGTINTLSNMTHDFSFYVFDIGVAYKEDTDRVVEVLQQLAADLRQEEPYASAILEPLEALGVDRFGDSAVIVKARIKTKPIMQWMVGREMNRRIKKRFDELGIEIPFPHRSLYFGEASKPFALQAAAGERERLKAIVADVLQEWGYGEKEPPAQHRSDTARPS